MPRDLYGLIGALIVDQDFDVYNFGKLADGLLERLRRVVGGHYDGDALSVNHALPPMIVRRKARRTNTLRPVARDGNPPGCRGLDGSGRAALTRHSLCPAECASVGPESRSSRDAFSFPIF